ncbi:hormogonium polysaccharide biosynthesis glycosyltransferase HpsE [Okeania sp.]|uniref:hormogonium polysaccharide biosynthesis glycosyltransferase HpsE n=1 Tax=Okeania sp. TaxID=3100323 RepID=UPI002B4ABF72|nr:hormogonium polysaccharide biosynthesis glycosyltransferase HpsE [Okeania sp.]MEB3341993.1 hormogonium polysaccharide biosynthesis glycosyltransferase HpsE [Okeania sp.]
MKQIKFTVAIPTYNGEKRLPKVLDKLREQINTEHFDWEILVVDNNSKDNTAKVVQDYQKNWSQSYNLRYCFEAEQGLAFARQKAIEAAKGELIGFIDDDVFPAPDWVSMAYKFAQEYPKAGAYGGQIHGDFEVEPPENFGRIKSFLAIKERGSKAHLYNPENLSLPPGAGLVVRKKAWLENVPQRLVRTTRGGNDFEISLHLHRGGWEIWYNPDMHLDHKIPSWRLERDYLLSLSRTVGLCICELRLINIKSWQKPIVMTKIVMGSLRRAILHIYKYRQNLQTDLVAACELEFFLSSMLSPFELIKKQFMKSIAVNKTS